MRGPSAPSFAADPAARCLPRSFRELIIDLASLMLAIGVGLLSFWPRLRGGPDPSAMIDLLIGSAGCLALVLRHRWTTALALVLTALSAVDVTIGGAALVATFAVAVRRPLVVVAWAGLLGVAASLVNAALYQGNHVPYLANATIAVLADSQRPRRGFGIPSRRLAGRDCTCRGVIPSGAHQMLVDLRAVVGLLRENPDEDRATAAGPVGAAQVGRGVQGGGAAGETRP